MCFTHYQNSDELDTDTEFEPVEDMTIETRSRCKDFRCIIFLTNFFSLIFICKKIWEVTGLNI